MRLSLIILAVLAFSLLAFTSNSNADADIYSAIESVSPGDASIIMEYHWVYGIDERVEIRADGLMRIERRVHDQQLFDRLNARLFEKGKLNPYEQSMYEMEEGDYDAYWVGDAGPAAFDTIINTLKNAGFPDIDETYGDWEVWSITLSAGDTEYRVGQVLHDWDAGFELALFAIEALAETVKAEGPVDEETFGQWFDEPETTMGGAS
jgi:hypothetical protein